MASLIPDVGNVRPDTAGAGRLYQAAMEAFQRSLNAPMERIDRLQAKQLEEDRYNTELGFKTRAEERLINKEKEDKEKELATNNALALLLDPNKVTSLNTAAGDTTTQNQINMYNQANSDGIVTPQEQALIDARYKEDLSKDVFSNPFVDQSRIFNARNTQNTFELNKEKHLADIEHNKQTLAAQRQRYNEQRAYENDMKKLNYEEKYRNILDRESDKNLLIEQAIALKLDPRAKSIDQLKSDITEASKTMDFKRVQLSDPNTGEIITTLQAVPKTKSDAAIRQDVEDMTNAYTKLKNNVAGNSSGILSGKTNKTIDAAEKAGINPNVIESILANVNIVNQSNLIDDEEFDYTSSEFGKVTYKDPVTQKQVPLDVYLKAVAESDVINRYTEKGLKGFGSIVNMSQEDKDKFAKDLEKLLPK